MLTVRQMLNYPDLEDETNVVAWIYKYIEQQCNITGTPDLST